MSERDLFENSSLVVASASALVRFETNDLFTKIAAEALDSALSIARADDAEAVPAFEKGEQCLSQRNYAEAIKFYMVAAELGHRTAQLRLGGIYLEGLNGPPDYASSYHWFSRASDQGEPRAQLKMGWMHEAGLGVEADNRRAVYWYRVAAEAGNPEAQFNIGVKYDNGEGVEHNPEEAVRWFLLAAEQGLADARYFLGQALENGEGIPVDLDEAIDWYFLAAEQGHASARRRFWNLCVAGSFKPESYEEAVFAECIGYQLGNRSPLFSDRLGISEVSTGVYEQIILASGGDVSIQFSLGHAYANGSAVRLDELAAIYWYKAATEKNNSGAWNNLGVLYGYSGRPFSNNAKAAECFRKAHELNSAIGTYNYATRLLDGIGVRKSTKRAVKLLEQAANSGYALAMTKLADLYYSGEIVVLNYRKAFELYERAAAANSAAGFFGLGLIYGQGFWPGKDLEIARANFEKAVELNPNYANRLANFFDQGIIFNKDPAEAGIWRNKVKGEQPVSSNQKSEEFTRLAGRVDGKRIARLNEKRIKQRPILDLFD
jgi:TPR repeat protein